MQTLALALMLVALGAPGYPAGFEVHTSECASGGFDYFFFEDGTVIAKCWGCEAKPYVQVGTWKREGEAVRVKMKQEWFGKGRGRVVEVASVYVYGDYVGERRTGDIRTDVNLFDAASFSDSRDGCDYALRHGRSPDPHSFLRLFDGEHPETFERTLTAAELERQPVDQLRVIRNEVFARYGYRFKDVDLATYFSKHKEYRPTLSNVDAFLSDIERENVALLQAAEKAKTAARRPVGK